MLEGMIKEGVIEDFAAFSQEAAKKKKARVAKVSVVVGEVVGLVWCSFVVNGMWVG